MENNNTMYEEEQKFYQQNIEESKYEVKEYKKKNLDFTYLSAYSFEKEYCSDFQPEIIGDVKLWQSYKEDRKDTIARLLIPNKKAKYTSFNILDNKKKKDSDDVKNKKAVGYIKVGENQYVRMLYNGFPIIILFLLLLICAVGCFFVNNKETVPEEIRELLPVDNNTTDWDGELEHGETSTPTQESIEIPGYANLFASEEKPTINLINPTNNTVYFKYEIYNGEELIYETNLIEPDKMVEWDAHDTLDTGEYALTFVISCYDITDQSPCNGANQTVNISIQ